MFDVMDLKQICELFVYSEIAIKNVIQILLIADKYKAIKLKFKAIQVIVDNMPEIRNRFRSEWLQLISNPESADQIIEVMDKQKTESNAKSKSIL